MPLNAKAIRAISLDLDDTLWPVVKTIHNAEEKLREYLQQVAPTTAAAFDGGNIKRWRHQVVTQHPDRKHDLSFLRSTLIQFALREHGDDEGLALPAFEVFFAARQQVEFYDDALPALRRLAAKFPLVALSNGNADIHKIGLGEFFVARITSSTLDVVKPHRRVFEHAAALAGADLGSTLHVGDDVALDVLGALRAGMPAAWIEREGRSWQQAEAEQKRLHAQYGLSHEQLVGARPDEQPTYQSNNLLDLAKQLGV